MEIEISEIRILGADNKLSFHIRGVHEGTRYIEQGPTPLWAIAALVVHIAQRRNPSLCQRCYQSPQKYHCRRCRKYICSSCRGSQVGMSTRQAICEPCTVR